ncbi:MAG: exo-beta-N-acetylmuramidase NamZ family protein, partial [Athalassotoga sp.]|uniref:exo-beta-N-acetylmuramidase NamZ family protein n=2 Tax=Athalassotoga sp. TaxID=2022597 RepID=UPI003D004C71
MRIKIGIDNLFENQKLKDARTALLTNSTGISGDMRMDLDVIIENGIKVVKLFGPEHGIWGAAADGVKVENEIESRYKIPIYSLYGNNLKPTDEMLDGIDAMIYDIQDVGLRFYTYIYTLAYTMEACGKHGIKFIVLDRPNPLSGKIEGPVIKKDLESFVGGYGLPLRYGLTAGEVAKYYNDVFKMNVDLEIVKMNGWNRDMYYDQTSLFWNTPSPNLPALEHTILYEGFCLLEGINVSVGRGTVHPFKYIGAPWIDDRLYDEMKKISHPGVEFRKRVFVPLISKYKGKRCNGLEFFVTDKNKIRPLELTFDFIRLLKEMYRNDFEWEFDGRYHFDLLIGDERYRKGIDEGRNGAELSNLWIDEDKAFKDIASKYFIYGR